MHERNVMHRDLKTENILLSFVRIVKLTLELNKTLWFRMCIRFYWKKKNVLWNDRLYCSWSDSWRGRVAKWVWLAMRCLADRNFSLWVSCRKSSFHGCWPEKWRQHHGKYYQSKKLFKFKSIERSRNAKILF
jgi:hypothetical protein